MTLIDYGLIHDKTSGILRYGTINKVERSIERLKEYEPPEGYFLAFSGGKDSVVLKRLADMAGVKYEAHYHITTLDPPELVKFIKQQHPDVIRDKPEINAWDLMVKKKMPPTRLARYCCEVLKEHGGKGRVTLTGVRWAESSNRKKKRGITEIQSKSKKHNRIYTGDNDEYRRTVEAGCIKGKMVVNPIVDWTDAEIWEFIHAEKIPYCSLYDEGFKRLGCIGCPMAGDLRKKEFERWPGFERRYKQTFSRIIDARKAAGLIDSTSKWQTAESMFAWWMEEPEEQPYDMGLFEAEGWKT